jgi:beta-mannosidase
MGLMYWQINDIWQAPTWATIDYELRWKMSHYYVRYMYSPIYPIAILTPYLANTTDETAQVSLYVVNDLFDGTRGVLTCGVYTLDSFDPQISFGDDVVFNSSGVQRVMNVPYAPLMKRTSCTDNSSCIIHCLFVDQKHQVRQTLFLKRPKNYQLSNPNIKIRSVTPISTNDFLITITADKPALFVWLDVTANITGYFSRNGFNMFTPVVNVSFYSWIPITNLQLRLPISLFDVTQP